MRSADGKRGGGQNLKKSPFEGANHCLRRRKRLERETASLPDLVSSGANSCSAISFQLEDDFRNCRHHLVDFLFPAVSRNDPESASCGIPYSSDAPYPWRSSRHLGWSSQPSQSSGPGLCKSIGWTDRDRISAGLCSGTQSGRIHLGPLETS